MLSQNALVKARKAFESMYAGTCDIIEHKKVKLPNKSTGFEDVVVVENQPCRLSFQSIGTTNQTENAAASVVQVTKVFLSPEVEVATGSKLTITQNGRTTEFKSSGKPAVYSTHQEIILELFKRWS